jgi:hypothetical protein
MRIPAASAILTAADADKRINPTRVYPRDPHNAQ